MNKKVIGIITAVLLLATILPITGMARSIEKQTQAPSDSIEGTWFVRGLFTYVDEDDDYVYLRLVLHTSIFGIKDTGGVATYSIFGHHPLKFAKPFQGFLPKGTTPMPAIGICSEWGYFTE